MSNKILRKSTSRGSRSRKEKDSWILNSRSVAKLMHIKQKIRATDGKGAAKKENVVLINDKPALAAYDDLHEQKLTAQQVVAKDLAKQQESL